MSDDSHHSIPIPTRPSAAEFNGLRRLPHTAYVRTIRTGPLPRWALDNHTLSRDIATCRGCRGAVAPVHLRRAISPATSSRV